MPRSVVWIARANLAAVALVLLAGLIGGVVMQLELWSPGPQWSQHFYSKMHDLHHLASLVVGVPALAGCFGYLVVARTVDARRLPAPALAWIALGLWLIGVALFAYLVGRGEDSGWTHYTPYSIAESRSRLLPELFAPLALASAGLLYATHLALIVLGSLRAVSPSRIALAAIFVVAVAVAALASVVDAIGVIAGYDVAILGMPAPRSFAAAWISPATRVAAIVLATSVLIGRRGNALALTACGIGVLWAVEPVLLLALGLLGVWIALAVVNGFWRPGVAFVIFGCGSLLAVRGFANLFAPSDVRLHDTHFVVGAVHAVNLVFVFAGLAVLHAWSDVLGRIPHTIVAWLGLSLAAGGAVLHCFASLRSGALGMPRRYWNYDPAFADAHQLVGIGGGILIAGLVALALAWLVGSRSK